MSEDSYVGKKKRLATDNRHVPNKAERKLLTQMMQASGLDEEGVRAIKANRQKLAEARNSLSFGKGGSNKDRLRLRELRKQAAEKLGTHINDPRVDAEVRKVWGA